MSAEEQVSRLEALLARVKSRRDVPRKHGVDGASGLQAREEAPKEAAPVPPEPTTPIPSSAVMETAHLPPPEEVSTTASLSVTAELEVDVEVAEGTAEIDLDGIEADELMADSLAAEGLGSSVADLEATVDHAPSEVDVPASSRRPIQLEPALGDLAFDETAEVKAHPAPPESGRQPALPEEDLESSGVRPMVDTDQSAPGLEASFSDAPASVPPAPTAPPPPHIPEMIAREPALAAAELAPAPAPVVAAAAVPLAREVTRPAAVAAEPAAVFRGAAPEFKPRTFGELLDATLGL